MSRLVRTIRIARPPGDVFARLVDVERIPEWSTLVLSTSAVSDRPVRLGTTFVQTLRLMGREIESDWSVVALEKDREVAFRGRSGGAEVTMTQEVEPDGDGTTLRFAVEYRVPGGIVVRKLVERMIAQSGVVDEAEQSLRNLRDLVEQG